MQGYYPFFSGLDPDPTPEVLGSLWMHNSDPGPITPNGSDDVANGKGLMQTPDKQFSATSSVGAEDGEARRRDTTWPASSAKASPASTYNSSTAPTPYLQETAQQRSHSQVAGMNLPAGGLGQVKTGTSVSDAVDSGLEKPGRHIDSPSSDGATVDVTTSSTPGKGFAAVTSSRRAAASIR